MENHHHEETKPTNKWIATPILMAVIVIGIIATFLSFAAPKCCEGKCDAKSKTEHGTTHEDGHGDVNHEETAVADTTKAATDSTTATNEHSEHSNEGHGH